MGKLLEAEPLGSLKAAFRSTVRVATKALLEAERLGSLKAGKAGVDGVFLLVARGGTSVQTKASLEVELVAGRVAPAGVPQFIYR